MPELPPIVIVMLLIACAFVMVMTLSVIRWPTIPAYFIAGMMVGPSGLGILTDSETGHFVAELGVIFLLFTIGLKFSLSSLLPIRRYVIWLGGAQTFFTAAVFGLPVFFLTDDFFAVAAGRLGGGDVVHRRRQPIAHRRQHSRLSGGQPGRWACCCFKIWR